MHYSAYKRHIDRIRCLNVIFYAFFSERRGGRVVETVKKAAQNFLIRFSITSIHFQCFELGQQ